MAIQYKVYKNGQCYTVDTGKPEPVVVEVPSYLLVFNFAMWVGLAWTAYFTNWLMNGSWPLLFWFDAFLTVLVPIYVVIIFLFRRWAWWNGIIVKTIYEI